MGTRGLLHHHHFFRTLSPTYLLSRPVVLPACIHYRRDSIYFLIAVPISNTRSCTTCAFRWWNREMKNVYGDTSMSPQYIHGHVMDALIVMCEIIYIIIRDTCKPWKGKRKKTNRTRYPGRRIRKSLYLFRRFTSNPVTYVILFTALVRVITSSSIPSGAWSSNNYTRNQHTHNI